MRRLPTAVAAAAALVFHGGAAHALPGGGLVHEISVTVPGFDGCTFGFSAFSEVRGIRQGDGTVDVVEIGSFSVTGEGEFCEAPVVPTEVHIYDRSPGLPTYHTRGVYGASQVVEYAGIPDIMSAQGSSGANTPLPLPLPRTAGVVAIEFRAPLLGVCLMDLYAVTTPGAAVPIGSFAPCPVVEP